MKLVVDSNVLFTFFWKNSAFNKLSTNQNLAFFSPEYALEEINKYAFEIIKKSKIFKDDFTKLKKELALLVEFISLKEYSHLFKEAELLIKNPSKNEASELLGDIDFFALALKLNSIIWSNDYLFKKQSTIKVVTTKEILDLFS